MGALLSDSGEPENPVQANAMETPRRSEAF